MGTSRRGGARIPQGVCLLCEHRIPMIDGRSLEDDFFAHFAAVHHSGEPLWTITEEGIDGE